MSPSSPRLPRPNSHIGSTAPLPVLRHPSGGSSSHATERALRPLLLPVLLLLATLAFRAPATEPEPPTPASVPIPAPALAIAAPTDAAPAAGSDAPNTSAFSTMATLDDKRKLALGDRLSFRIAEDLEDPKEPPDPKPIFVTDSGDVELPYLGRFPALGKTCRQLSAAIKTELEKTYYFQATVIVALDLLAKSTGRVYLVGQLRVTGAQEIPSDEVFTLSKAILRSGGFTEFADMRRVKLTRMGTDASGKPQRFVVNVNDILENGKSHLDLKLEPGDLIFVPSRLVNF